MESGVLLYNMPLTGISGENYVLVLETRARIEDLRQQNVVLLESFKAARARVNVLEKRISKIRTATICLIYGLGTVAAILIQKGCAG